jgi:glyoxylase-like metal-dependent hydrolase (beta-lactamase superfamily II)
VTRLTLNHPEIDLVGLRAANPGPFTLDGTNSWIVGRDPAWLVDPGPALPDHLAALQAELEDRGGLGGIALTHDHPDHAEAVGAVRERFPAAAFGAWRGEVTVRLAPGERFGPFEVLALPGHAPDHLVFLVGSVACCGDAVLGQGSVFIAPDPGALRGYLDGLTRLRARQPTWLLPGHGPVIEDPAVKIDEYIAHRRAREQRLVDALEGGARGVDELLDRVWSDVPAELRGAAAVTLAAHLDKLAEEGRLPAGVQRPGGL